MDADRLRQTETFLHAQIPLARAMGVRVEAFDRGELTLTAPLEPNHNHLGTAFGGSLAALATLAGYAQLWLALGEPAAHVVIRQSALRYRRPVRGVLRALCAPPGDGEMSAFLEKFRTAGKARLSLAVRLVEGGETCVEFEGEFVALASHTP